MQVKGSRGGKWGLQAHPLHTSWWSRIQTQAPSSCQSPLTHPYTDSHIPRGCILNRHFEVISPWSKFLIAQNTGQNRKSLGRSLKILVALSVSHLSLTFRQCWVRMGCVGFQSHTDCNANTIRIWGSGNTIQRKQSVQIWAWFEPLNPSYANYV